MLFFKRISDVYDEEYQIAKKEAGGDEKYAHYHEHYRFQIPDKCHWQANPDPLHGIFGDAQ